MTLPKLRCDVQSKNLYAAFKQYDISKPMYGCDHCVSKDDIAFTFSKPMRELTWNELDKYSFKALTTFGDLADFKKFLPRICELVAFDGKNSGTEWPTALGKIDYAEQEYRPGPEIPTFDDAERLAIMQFLFRLVDADVGEASPDPDDNSRRCICMIDRATSNLWPFLDCWKTSRGTTSSPSSGGVNQRSRRRSLQIPANQVPVLE